MPSSCKDLRDALAACLQSSPCVLQDRHTAYECLTPPLVYTLPTQCQQLKRGFRDCKRGMVDMRKRFRGNQPISVSAELEGGGEAGAGFGAGGQKTLGIGGGGQGVGQLYGGKPAFEVVRGKSAEEMARDQMDPEKTRGL